MTAVVPEALAKRSLTEVGGRDRCRGEGGGRPPCPINITKAALSWGCFSHAIRRMLPSL